MSKLKNYLISIVIMLVAIMITSTVQPFVDQSSLVMVYMLAVVTTAFFLSIGPAILISLCSVVVFDYLNLPPYMEFTRKPAEYVFTLTGMLITAATISTLAARLRQKLRESKERELRTSALYALSAALAETQSNQEVIAITLKHLSQIFATQAEILTSQQISTNTDVFDVQRAVLSETLSAKVFKYEHGAIANVFIPLHANAKLYGIVSLATTKDRLADIEQTEHLQAMIRQSTQAIERNNLHQKIHESDIRIQQESLRNTILNAISHDLRTPLATIMGASSSLIEQDIVSVETRNCLSQAIYEEAIHMQNMVENLLEMARLQSGDIHISQDWQAIEEIVGSALLSARRRIKHHDIIVDVPDDLPLIRCDSTLIERVLINLLENAAKYSPDGTVIQLKAKRVETYIQLSISDKGLGIPEDQLDKVFDPFYRGHSTKTGFGLGLSICRGIADVHHGHIVIQSTIDRGTTVIVSLPIPIDSPALELEVCA